MRREELVDLNAFMAVAEDRSFTRAAAKLGTSQSALSHTIRRLEARLGVRLLTRNTRNVVPTDAGELLLATLQPALESIGEKISSLANLRDKPAGTIRITTSEHAATVILWPAVQKLLAAYSDINIELSIDSSLNDIVAERFDAGVRLGEGIAKDMIATRIGPDLRMVVVGSPDYLKKRPVPMTPNDLADHCCVSQRMASGGILSWELEKDGREVRVRPEGQLVLNNTDMIVRAALSGAGLAFVMQDRVADYLSDGRLRMVLADWCPSFTGYHLYYPSRREHSTAFKLLLDALRYRPPSKATLVNPDLLKRKIRAKGKS